MISDNRKRKKQVQEKRSEYLMTLPVFLSQLLLLLGSGMILQTAFHRIAEGYDLLPEDARKGFVGEICRLHHISVETGENVVILFSQFSRESGVKELTRAANIMMENLDRGTDLWEKLENEGNHLWQERKRIAMERIRISESKMSFPLGLLLIALLLVTAGPAMMQMG